jgi:exonuclease SbcC
MKPVSLELAGLQSYREAQSIDFTKLCDAGVFGIFGPTGSGKSTILDAMTLALYGKVERAVKDTQGIMNQAEDTLSVAFTFELNDADKPRRYRVERQFKRSGDISVKNTVSRLIRIEDDGAPVVIADKMSEVNARVESILGLTMDDFTRAVVLPQGKFAEFLSLKGSERRQMLQRLFNLEHYGDLLSAKVAARFKETEAALRQIAAEQQGLGDASAQALASAEERLKEATAHASAQRQLLQEGEARFEERKQVRQWLQEKAALEGERERLKQRDAEIGRRERQLQLGEQAERLRPYLEAWEAARETLRASEMRLMEAAGQAQLAAEACGRAEQAAEAARQLLNAEEGPLLVHLAQLEKAQRMQAELSGLRQAEQELSRRLQDAAQRMEAAAAQCRKEEETLQKALRRQSELKEELKNIPVTAAERERLQAAFAAKQQLDRLRAQLKDWAEQRVDHELQLEKLARREIELAAAHVERLQALEPHLARLAEEMRRLRRVEAVSAELIRQLPAAIGRAREADREREARRLAALLAERLTPGAACPVCGSTHHPAPAHAAADAGDGGEAARLEELLKAAQETEFAARQLALRLDAVLRRAQSVLPRQAARLIAEALRSADDAPPASSAFAPPEAIAGMAAGIAAVSEAASEAAAARETGAEAAWETSAVAGAFAAIVRQREQAAAREAAASRRLEEVAREIVAALQDPQQSAANGSADSDEVSSRSRLLSENRQAEQALLKARRMIEEGQSAARELERLLQRCAQDILSLSGEKQDVFSRMRAQLPIALAAREKEHAAKLQLAGAETSWRKQFPSLSPGAVDAEMNRMAELERQAEQLRERIEKSETFIDGLQRQMASSRQNLAELEKEHVQLAAERSAIALRAEEKERDLKELIGSQDADELTAKAKARLAMLRRAEQERKNELEAARAKLQEAGQRHSAAREAHISAAAALEKAEERWRSALARSAFATPEEVKAAYVTEAQKEAWTAEVQRHKEAARQISAALLRLDELLGGRNMSDEEWIAEQERIRSLREAAERALEARAKAERDLEELAQKHRKWVELENRRESLEQLHERLGKLQSVLRANAFVEFIAEEQLMQVSRAASERLGQLTRRRYALEVDSGGGFVIRDDANGGIRRPVTTLSGGETFLASLALALALSAQIQLRGRYPLEFFFLDEGFGTLDPDLLETVVSSLERLHMERLTVGVISHVPELKMRLPRRLIVHPAEPGGRGSRISIETL